MGITMEAPDPHTAKVAADVVASSVLLATFMAWLPAGAALLAIIWYIIQIGSWAEERWLKKKRRLVRKRR